MNQKTSPQKPAATSISSASKQANRKKDKDAATAKTVPSAKKKSPATKEGKDAGSNEVVDERPKKRVRHGAEDKSFARRAKPSGPDALNQWTAIRDAYNAELSHRFGASRQDS